MLLAAAMITVTLDVFSGRPNPEWTLSAKEEVEFTHRLALASPTSTGAHDQGEPLGYRGFRVHTSGASGLPAELRVYNGWISGDRQTWQDRGRTMELWLLLDTGRTTITADLVKYVKGEIFSSMTRP